MFPEFVVSLEEYLVINVYKCSKAVRGHTGSPELGCQFPNFNNFGKMSVNTLVTADGGFHFVDCCDSLHVKTRRRDALDSMVKGHSGDSVSTANLHFLALSSSGYSVVLGISTRMSLDCCHVVRFKGWFSVMDINLLR